MSALATHAATMPAEYYADVVLSGRLKGPILTIPRRSYEDLCARWGPWTVIRRAATPTYAAVRTAIATAAAGDPCQILQDELRILDRMLTLHSHRPPCWRHRQEQRLIRQYMQLTGF